MNALDKWMQKQKHHERNPRRDLVTAASGAHLASLSPELLTGRSTFYHGTDDQAAKRILNEGLKTETQPGIGKMLDDKLGADKYVYVDRNPHNARIYAQQASSIKELIKENPKKDAQKIIREYSKSPKRIFVDKNKALFGLGDGQVLKAKIPLWKMETFKNPELYGAKNFLDLQKIHHEKLNPINMLEAIGLYKSFSHPVFKELGPEHFVKSPSYKELGFKELKQYLRKHPGKALSGLGLAAGGTALLAHGARNFYNDIKSSEENRWKAKLS